MSLISSPAAPRLSRTSEEINFRFSWKAQFFSPSCTCWVSACYCGGRLPGGSQCCRSISVTLVFHWTSGRIPIRISHLLVLGGHILALLSFLDVINVVREPIVCRVGFYTPWRRGSLFGNLKHGFNEMN